MTTTNRKVIHAAVRTLLHSITPGNGYTHDLSADNAVTFIQSRGQPATSSRPRVEVVSLDLRESRTQGGDLSHFGQEMPLRLYGLVPYAGSPDATLNSVCDLEADIRAAFHDDRKVGGTCHDVEVSTLPLVAPSDSNRNAPGELFAEVTLYWRRR